jgi:RNA polymerase sigma factor (sigma-70 family)
MMSILLELNTLDDEVLFERWADGEARAGHVLFKRHFDAVLRFFRRQLGDDASDLVQNTFLGCVKARGRFAQKATFRTYLFAIARFQLYKEFRRRQGRPELDFRVTSVEDLGPSLSRVLGERQEMTALVEALGRVALEQQLAIYFYYLEDMTAPEVGVALGGLGVPAVRSRLRRGLEALRKGVAERPRQRGDATLATLERWEASLPVLATGEHEPAEHEIAAVEPEL